MTVRYQTSGFLTRQDFEALYDACGEVLHMRNPFSNRDPLIRINYPPIVYAARIERLIARHLIRLVDRNTVWLVTVPDHGDPQMVMAEEVRSA